MYRHPSHLAKTSLFAVLLGVAIPLAIQNLAGNDRAGRPNFSADLLVANLAFVLTALNFYHAKVVATEDSSYLRRLQAAPLLAALDFWLHAMLFLSFTLMAVCLGDPRRIAYSNIAVRLVDCGLIALMIRLTVDCDVRRSLRYWVVFNVVAILAFGGWLLTSLRAASTGVPFVISTISGGSFVSWMFLGIVGIDIAIDYAMSKNVYFDKSSDWGEIARFWDAAQGVHGDVYRRCVVNPALGSLLGGLSVARGRELKILDLGCGNGCVARYLSSRSHRVLAVDKFPQMLDLAQTYTRSEEGRLEYLVADVDVCQTIEGQTIRGPFDVVLACFSFQDCGDLEAAFRLAAHNVSDGGHLVIVYEDLAALEDGSSHLSARLWLGDKRPLGRGGAERAQLVTWNDAFIRIAQDEKAHYDFLASNPACDFTVKTTVRDEMAYLGLAKAVGFDKVAGHSVLLRSARGTDECVDSSSVLRSYEARPRMSMLCLQYTGQLASHGSSA